MQEKTPRPHLKNIQKRKLKFSKMRKSQKSDTLKKPLNKEENKLQTHMNKHVKNVGTTPTATRIQRHRPSLFIISVLSLKRFHASCKYFQLQLSTKHSHKDIDKSTLQQPQKRWRSGFRCHPAWASEHPSGCPQGHPRCIEAPMRERPWVARDTRHTQDDHTTIHGATSAHD